MRTPRCRMTALLALATTAAMLTSLAPSAAQAGRRRARVDRTIAPGVVFSRITDPGPNEISLLTIDPRKAQATTDVALASSSYPGWARTSQMATADNAIAAVNGDFGISPGRPLHSMLMDGQLVQSGIRVGNAFAVPVDGTAPFADHPVVNVAAYVPSSRASFGVAEWNSGSPSGNDIARLTPVGGSTEKPPRGDCSVRLQPAGAPAWTSSKQGIQRLYTVQATSSGSGSMSVNGGVVLSARSGSAGATSLKALNSGAQVRLTVSYPLPGILDSTGGNPQLPSHGHHVAPP